MADTFSETSPTFIHRRWNAPQGSPAPKHRRPKPVQWGSVGHHKPTPIEPEGRVPDTIRETSSASIHRRWKSPRGSSFHKPTKSSHQSTSNRSSIRASGITVIGSSALLIPDCTSIAPGATDTPASRNGSTGHLSRSTCGFTDATVAECPWLCTQGGDGLFNGCYDRNFTGVEPLDEFPPLVCTHCLPPCNQTSSSSLPTISMDMSGLPSSHPRAKTPIPTCTSIGPGEVDTSASRDNDTGLLFRSSCGASDATVAECPYLCSQGGGGFLKECSNDDLTGSELTGQFPPTVCTHCLPPCKQAPSTTVPTMTDAPNTTTVAASRSSVACTTLDPFVGTIPSTKDNSTGAFLRFECGLSFELAYECPYLCGYEVGEKLGQCYDQDNSASVPKNKDKDYTCTHCFYPSRKFTASSASDEPTCTSINPYSRPCPSSVRFDDSTPPIRYQTACGTQASDIKNCPYLCTAVDKPNQYHCENEDLGGTIFKPTGTTQVCVQCLPEC